VNNEKGITSGQSRASSGESFVEARLKSFAQVSHPNLQYATDFYCRLLKDGKPSDKLFGVEVKSTRNFKECFYESIEKEKLEFWLISPFPIYIVVYEEESDTCYWTAVEDNRQHWERELMNENESITIKIDRINVLEKKGNDAFIQKINMDIIIVNASRGIAEFIIMEVKGTKGYAIGYIPVLKLNDKARESIRARIRFGLNYLINDSVLGSDKEGAYSMLKMLGNFDHAHYDHFLSLARICRDLGKKKETEKNYKIAIEICKSDSIWDQRETAKIEKELQEFISQK